MDITRAEQLCVDLMKEHGVAALGWQFRFDNAKSRLGHCVYQTKVISLSRYMVAAADESVVRNTALHEIAHALLGPRRADGSRYGHGPEWKRLAREIGCTGERTSANPYQELVRVRRVATPPPAGLDPVIRLGDIVRLTNGVSGEVLKKARTRYHIKGDDGRGWSAPFDSVVKIADRDPNREPVAPAVPLLGVGDFVVLSNGISGKILKVGTSRYKVDGSDGRVWNSPFALVTKAPAGSDLLTPALQELIAYHRDGRAGAARRAANFAR